MKVNMEKFSKEIVDNQNNSNDGFKHLSMSNIINRYATDENPNNFKMHIGTGFFFLSGFNTIKNSLINSNRQLGDDEYLKSWGTKAPFLILMGKETNNLTKSVLSSLSQKNIEEEFKKNISYLETEDIKCLEDLYKEGYIKFKVFTEAKFHVKIYFFLEEKLIKDIYAGSANLTPSGLIHNLEFSAPISGTNQEKNQYHQWFKSLWDKSTDDFNVLKVIEEYRSEDFLYLEPRDFFINLLSKLKEKRYLFNNTSSNEESVLLEFQKIDTVNVCNKLEENGGCILASSVGLGKSFVALETINYYLSHGKKVLLIAPSGILEGNWKKEYLHYYNLIENPNLFCLGEGKLRQELEDSFFSSYEGMDLICVDEAHFLRNMDTNVRNNFKKIYDMSSSEPKLLMLTATPINTKIQNIVNLFEFIFSDKNIGKFHNTTLLRDYERFKELVRKVEIYKNATENEKIEMMQLMEVMKYNFVVQTMRQDLKKYFKSDLEKISGSSEILDPKVEEIQYNYSKEYREEIFDNIVNFLEGLNYENSKFQYLEESGEWEYKEDKNLINIYKWNLYKGLESSLYAFYTSLVNHKDKVQLYLDYFKSGDDKEIDRYIQISYNASTSRKKFKNKIIAEKKNVFDNKEVLRRPKKEVLDNLQKDLELCLEYISKLDKFKMKESKLFRNDLKLKTLLQLLNLFENKRWIIFSERTKTIEMLEEFFNKENINCVTITGKDNSIEKNSKIQRFKAGKYKHILASDALSQGFNLAEADGVINFDLPYNPVYLIQRSGRVTRLDVKKEASLKNFNPSDEINKELELIEKLDLRIENIISFMGIDYSIWKKHEELVKNSNKKKEVKTAEVLKSLRNSIAKDDPEALTSPSNYTKSQKLDTLLKRAIEKYQISEDDLLEKVPVKPFYTSLKDNSLGEKIFGIYKNPHKKIEEYGDIHIENSIIEGNKKEYNKELLKQFLSHIKENKLKTIKDKTTIKSKKSKEIENWIYTIKNSNIDEPFKNRLLNFYRKKNYSSDILSFYKEIYAILKSREGFNRIKDREIYNSWNQQLRELEGKYSNFKEESNPFEEFDNKLSSNKKDIVAFINYEVDK